jgi:hypothetical protein
MLSVSGVDCGNGVYVTVSDDGNWVAPKKDRGDLCLRFRRRQKKMAKPAPATATIPAITPPAMAPVLG